MTRVLVLDADAAKSRALVLGFAQVRPDIEVSAVASESAAMRWMTDQPVDVLLAGAGGAARDRQALFGWVHEHSPETQVFTMGGDARDLDGRPGLSNGAGPAHFEEPLDVPQVVTRLCETINHSVRGHLENVSLASLLQLLEMERKTCTLTLAWGQRRGCLVVSKGVLVGARTDSLEGEAAAIAIVAWPSASIRISSRVVDAGVEIQASLGFILIEGMRLVDEATRHRRDAEVVASVWPKPRRTWRPSPNAQTGVTFDSARPPGELGLPSGASAFAVVETSTGNVLRSASRDDCPIGELARLASHLLLQEAATLRMCGETEDVEELVLSTTSRCDVIRPLSPTEFALLVFAPEETNLVIARLELDHFITVERASRAH